MNTMSTLDFFYSIFKDRIKENIPENVQTTEATVIDVSTDVNSMFWGFDFQKCMKELA